MSKIRMQVQPVANGVVAHWSPKSIISLEMWVSMVNSAAAQAQRVQR